MMTGWSAQRWLRLAFAIIFLVAGLTGREPVAFVAAFFFGAQALFNVGCSGTAPCATRTDEVTAVKAAPVDVVIEEIR